MLRASLATYLRSAREREPPSGGFSLSLFRSRPKGRGLLKSRHAVLGHRLTERVGAEPPQPPCPQPEKPSAAQLDTHLRIVCTRRMGRSVLRRRVSRGGSCLSGCEGDRVAAADTGSPRLGSSRLSVRFEARSVDGSVLGAWKPRRDRPLEIVFVIELRLLVLGGRRSGISKATEASPA
jgi:hypothetical protein